MSFIVDFKSSKSNPPVAQLLVDEEGVGTLNWLTGYHELTGSNTITPVCGHEILNGVIATLSIHPDTKMEAIIGLVS